MENPLSKIERIKLRGKETALHLATVDDLITYRTDDGGCVVDFVRWNDNRKPVESFRITLCPEDYRRLQEAR